jgi:hypothetical protein
MLARSRIFPFAIFAGAAWFVCLTSYSQTVKTAAVWFLMPPLLVLAYLGRGR